MDAGEAFGRYRLLEPIGQGAATITYRAKSFGVEGFEKTLVVKRVRPELCREARYVTAFVPAAQLAVRLSHANVVQVFDLGRLEEGASSSYFLAMEWVPGLDLGQLVEGLARRGERLPLAHCLWVASEIAKALEHAHRRRDDQLRPLGIAHLDLNPRNVRISLDGEVKVADFCITRALLGLANDPEPPPGIASKLPWLAPEVLHGEPGSPASDLYGLGAILAHLLGVQLQPATASRPVRWDGAWPKDEVPGALTDLVHALLAADPAARPASAGRVHETLSALRFGLGQLAGAPDLAELLARADLGTRGPERAELPSHLDLETTVVERVAAPPPASAPPSRPPKSAPSSRPAPSGPRSQRPASRGLPEVTLQAREATVLVLRFSTRGGATPSTRDRAREALRRWGARLLGDSPHEISATFGLASADGRDAENAARCALVLARTLAAQGLELGIGLAVGALRVGTDGQAADDEHRRALLMAARRQALAASGGVAIAQRDARWLRGLFALEASPAAAPDTPVKVRGTRPTEEALGGFVGRKAELRWLGERIAQSSRSGVQIGRVVGPPGIGKTRLVLEMDRRLRRADFRVACYLAVCPPTGRDLPLSGVAALLRAVCGLAEGDGALPMEAMEPRLRALGLVTEEVRAVLSTLGGTAEWAAGSEALTPALARMLQSLSEDQVSVLVWDDAQHLDEASRTHVSGALARVPQARTLLLTVERDSAGEPFSGVSVPVASLALGPLEDDDLTRLVSLRTGVASVPAELLSFVKARSAGHPMFVEELLHEAVESGALRVEQGQVIRLELASLLAVPRPLRSLLADRVRRLPREQQELLLASAVLGTPIDTSVLAAMLDVPLGAVNAHAEALEALDLLRRAGPVSLRFPSPLLSEVLLGSLPPDARRELHRQAANAYQAVLGERTEEESARIAYHLDQAGEPDRAAGYYATSGLAALASRRAASAAHDLTRALLLADLASRADDELTIWLGGLVRVARSARDQSAVAEAARRLDEHFTGGDREPGLVARALIDLGRVLAALHRFADARRLLERAEQAATDQPLLLAAGLAAQAELAVREGQLARALEVVHRAEALPQPEGVEGHRLLLAASQALGAAGELDAALRRVARAEALVDPADPELGCERAKARALAFAFSGDWASCAVESERAAELARAADLALELAVNLHNQGDALLHLGESPRAYAALDASLAVAREIGSERWVNANRLLQSYLEALSGSEEAPQELGARAARADAEGWVWDAITGRTLVGCLLRRRGEHTAARRELTLALGLARGTGNLLLVRDCELELAKLGDG